MTKYVVEYRAEGTVEVEAETSAQAAQEALDLVLALDGVDPRVEVDLAEQVRTDEAP